MRLANTRCFYTFTGAADGSGPYDGVILDAAGNLYGTTYNGGKDNAGVVAGQETVLHSFKGGNDGANPYGGVTFGPDGSLYGGTPNGGASEGVLYKVDLSGKETVIHTFDGGTGNQTYASVIFDAAANMYGSSAETVFEVNTAGHYRTYAYLGDITCASALVFGACEEWTSSDRLDFQALGTGLGKGVRIGVIIRRRRGFDVVCG